MNKNIFNIFIYHFININLKEKMIDSNLFKFIKRLNTLNNLNYHLFLEFFSTHKWF